MIKYIEAPDLHYSPGNQEALELVFSALESKASEVDFIYFLGDLFDRPIYATEKGGINWLRNKIKRLSKLTRLLAIYGTPSHEAPGSLDVLEDCGLEILKPGEHVIVKDCMVFGIPEVNKKKIQKKYQCSATEANGHAIKAVSDLIEKTIAPIRSGHKGPAVLGFHGVVSESSKENSSDIIVKSSDIVIKTEVFRPGNFNRVSLGHIHKPQEFPGNIGYAGSWGKTWGETGFIPGANIITIDGSETTIERLPYGTPMRAKIYKPLKKYDPSIAYWLETEDPEAPVPAGHPWSRVTLKAKEKESQRISAEDAENINGLDDLIKIIDPEVTESILEKARKIDSQKKNTNDGLKSIELKSVEISGSVFFKEKTVSLDVSELPDGLTNISGSNGSGKSSLLAFCSPYPIVIGKDTNSGRASSIKDFFSGPDSYIKKSIIMNGQEHEHYITIKGTHTQNPKVECFLTVGGESILDKGTFDEMMAECENLYGSFDEYLLTSFYVQPLQGKTKAGLIDAGITEIRNLVQGIAGIDREPEKNYCLEKVRDLSSKISESETWIEAVSGTLIDKSQVMDNIQEQINRKTVLDLEKSELENEKKALEKTREQAVSNALKSEQEESRQATDAQKVRMLRGDLGQIAKKIKESGNIDVEELKKIIEEENEIQKENLEIERENLEAEKKYQADLHAYNIEQSNLEKIKSLEEENKRIKDPCPNCGYIRDDVANKIRQNNAAILKIKDSLIGLQKPFKSMPIARRPVCSDYDISVMKEQIELSKKTDELKKQAAKIKKELAELESIQYEIDPSHRALAEKLAGEISERSTKLNDLSRLIASVDGEIKYLKNQIVESEKREEEIKTKKEELEKNKTDFDDWDYLAKILQPSKVPALELDIVASDIDLKANEILSFVQDGRFTVRTETQAMGKKKIVDRFDIIVYDFETAQEKSILQFSPGEKAILCDAYTKALIEQRNKRARRIYSPVIMDESDGPVAVDRIPDYYQIQSMYWNQSKVLVVSHNPVAHNYINNAVNIKELIK